MPLFSYEALDGAGKKILGRLEAGNDKEAVRTLRDQSVFVLSIREGDHVGAERGFRAQLNHGLSLVNPLRFLPVVKGDLVQFFHQISLMLRSGYTLVPALKATREMQMKISFIRVIDQLAESISAGASLSAAMKSYAKLFPPMMVNLISIGERSGNLDSILERLAENVEQSKELKRQLIGAMLYPTIVLLCSVGLVVYMVKKVIPSFASFLSARSSSLPSSTQRMMDVSEWALQWGGLVFGIFGVFIFCVLVAYTTRPGKKVVDGAILMQPLIGKAVQFSAMAQTGWSLSLCLRSGLPALDALRINAEAMQNAVIRESFEKAAEELLLGRSLSKAIDQPHVPLMMRHMAAVGEKSGELDTVMFDVGVFFQKELAAKVKMMSVLIEPVMIIGVGALVGFVYYSLFQAVMSVSKGGM